MAGGLAVREQSTVFQGMSFAGSAAGSTLSSSFWNSAAISRAAPGLSSESSMSVILPSVSITSEPGTVIAPGSNPVGDKVDMGHSAFVSASYTAYRLTPQLVAGIAINAPFGVANELKDPNWAGQMHGRSARILTTNINLMLSYNVLPNLAIGVGVMAQYARIQFKALQTGLPTQTSSGFEVDDIGFGGTAGILWTPVRGTDIGIGFRSAINHSFEGESFKVGDNATIANRLLGTFTTGFTGVGVKANVTLPETITASIKQDINATTRLFGTVEWTNWSRIQTIDFVSTGNGGLAPGGPGGLFPGVPIVPGQTVSHFDFKWHDGWLFSIGGEYDYSQALTLRAGVGYEISPIRNASERLTLVTDSDRTWLSAGFSYKITQNMTVDFGYSHVFFADAPIDRANTTSPTDTTTRFVGKADNSADILSVGFKTKW